MDCANQTSTDPPRLGPPGYAHQGGCFTYGGCLTSLHPVERAARVHSDFVKIHPFVDGNGRTGSLLMNLELMKAGYPAAVLTVDRRLAYYTFLDEARVRNNTDLLIWQINRITTEAFEPYFRALRLPWKAGISPLPKG